MRPEAQNLQKLVLHRVRVLQISPALDNLPSRDPPYQNARESEALLRYGVGARPVVANHHFIVLGDDVFDLNLQAGNFLKCGRHVLHCVGRPRWQFRRYIRAAIDEIGGETHFGDAQVFQVHEFLRVIVDKLPRLRLRHACLGIPGLYRLR